MRNWIRWFLYLQAAVVFCATSNAQVSCTGSTITPARWKTVHNYVTANGDYVPPVFTPDDTYHFVDPADPTHAIYMSDPTIAYVVGADGKGDYYITGTEAARPTNFRIFKTSDFRHFSFYKYAFDPSSEHGRFVVTYNPPVMYNGTTYIGYQLLYSDLSSPQLYVNGTEVELVFSAVVGQVLDSDLVGTKKSITYGNVVQVSHWDPYRSHASAPETCNPVFPFDNRFVTNSDYGNFDSTDAANSWDNIGALTGTSTVIAAKQQAWYWFNYFSLFHVSTYTSPMTVSDFTSSTPHYFGSVVQSFGYIDGDLYYDGGSHYYENGGCISTAEKYIPSSTNAYMIGIQTLRPEHYILSDLSCAPVWYEPNGIGHARTCGSGRGWYSSNTAMTDGGFAFIDPPSSQHWMLYGWHEGGFFGQSASFTCSGDHTWARIFGDANEDTVRGSHIAAAKLLNGSQWEFEHSSTTIIPIANKRNTNNVPNNQSGLYNGELFLTSSSTWTNTPSGLGIAESPSVFYDCERSVYHVAYNRNQWNLAAYNIICRSTARTSSNFNAMQIASNSSTSDAEQMLVSARWYHPSDSTIWDLRGSGYQGRGRCYANGEFFYLRDRNGKYILRDGHRVIYTLFSAKYDSSDYRTVFFKDLSYKTTTSVEFKDLVEESSDTQADTWQFQSPILCWADFDDNGFVEGTDFDEYVDAFEAGLLSADTDGDGFVSGDDYDLYVAQFMTGCD